MLDLPQAEGINKFFMEELDLVASEYDFNDALLSGQVSELERFLAEEWTWIDLFGGLMDKSSFLDAMWSGGLKFHSIVTEEIRARIYHQSAVVTGSVAMCYESRGLAAEIRCRFTHVYHKSNAVWRMVAAQVTSVQDDF